MRLFYQKWITADIGGKTCHREDGPAGRGDLYSKNLIVEITTSLRSS